VSSPADHGDVVALDAIAGVFVVTPKRYADERGSFLETYRHDWFPGTDAMVQANRADRRAGTLVGLHFHRHQADHWYVPAGVAQVVLHDLREGSPTAGATWSTEVGGEPGGDPDAFDHRSIYIPAGVAHGFLARTEVTITYLVDRHYDPSDELGVAWDDPDVGADWAIDRPLLSARDQANPKRSALELPPYRT
jgi:dTDP-4-dehydrorhamnose 3,5-epimerase